jgi:UTP--glucose-1-phosphate uridylyltransferase
MNVRKALIPVAGLGTRFLPATKSSPKEMLPLIDKPLVQYVVEEAVASGIEQILFVTGRGKHNIEDHFDISVELEAHLCDKGKGRELSRVREIAEMVNIFYVRQRNALGLGHAILCAKDFVGNEPFAVLLGDDIVDSERPCLGQLLDVFNERNGSVLSAPTSDRRTGRELGSGTRPTFRSPVTQVPTRAAPTRVVGGRVAGEPHAAGIH